MFPYNKIFKFSKVKSDLIFEIIIQNTPLFEYQISAKSVKGFKSLRVKSVQSALSDLLTTSATHGMFSRPSTKRGLISIIKLMQFTIVRFF